MCLTVGNKNMRIGEIVRCEIEAFSAVLYCEAASCPAVNYHWTGLLDWTTGMEYWNGLLEWTTGMDYWTTGLLEWTTGLTFFVLKSFLWPIMRFLASTCNI